MLLPLQSAGSSIRSFSLRSLSKIFFYLFIGSYIFLMFAGAITTSPLLITYSAIASIYYFSYFLIIMPTIHLLDTLIYIY